MEDRTGPGQHGPGALTAVSLPSSRDPVPLVVDLDGTLIDADTLHLALVRLAREQVWVLPALPFVVLRGRAAFKAFVSTRVHLDPASLPYRRDVVDFVRSERAGGRRVVLATAADERIAASVARYLALFDSIIASDGRHNAKGDGKVSAIRAHLGGGEFDYIGDNMADVPVFRSARRSYLVCPTPALLAAASGVGAKIERVFPDGASGAGREPVR